VKGCVLRKRRGQRGVLGKMEEALRLGECWKEWKSETEEYWESTRHSRQRRSGYLGSAWRGMVVYWKAKGKSRE